MAPKGSSDMLNVLQKHLEGAKTGCVVSKWLDGLTKEEQEAFKLVKEKSDLVSLSAIYNEISNVQKPPFGNTSFRMHFRESCTCPTNS